MSKIDFIPEYLIDDKVFKAMDILESCYAAIDEGINDRTLVDIARNNATSMILGTLDRSLVILNTAHDSLTAYINNYILNYAKLVEKYRSTIIQMYERITKPIIYRTFQYPFIKGYYPVAVNLDPHKYPNLMGLPADWSNFITHAKDFASDNEYEREEVRVYFPIQVDKIIEEYSKDTIGDKVRPNNIEADTKLIVQSKLRGSPKTVALTQRNLNDIINSIIAESKEMLKDVKATKPAFTKDNKTLHTLIERYPNNGKVSIRQSIKMLKYPDEYQEERAELYRFSDINLELNRLFSGLVSMYTNTYATKMQVIRERIDTSREVLVGLLQAAGAFSAINNKTAARNSKPLKDDELAKFKL